MLIIRRKLGERVRVGENVWVTLIETERGAAKIGFEAPKSVPIFREELLPAGRPEPPRGEGSA